jgi:serine/threonine protein kinase
MNNTGNERTLAAGGRLGPFDIVNLLGAGGMGEVWRARDSRLGRDVAVKVLPRAFALDADRLRRFEQEAKTLASLNHPSILVVFETGRHEGAPYLVSEFLEGQTLRQELSSGPLTPRKAIDYGLQVAQGLAAAHARGVIHRDLKPENLFVTREGRVKILDFGLAKFHGCVPDSPSSASSSTTATLAETTAPGVLLGTPGYMAPEQVRGFHADQRSDIFAFGAIFYEMLSGRRPFKRDTSVETLNSILNEDPPDLRETYPNISPMLERIVRRCLEKQADNRFQTAKDLAFAIENVAAASVVSALAASDSGRLEVPAAGPAASQPGAAAQPGSPSPPPAGPGRAAGASGFGFRPAASSDITAGMSSPESKAPTLQELPNLRNKTERIAGVLREHLAGHLETLRPLFAPERLFGKLAGGKADVLGAERALAELQQAFRNFTSKPYDLPASLDSNWLSLVGQVVALDPWEYGIAVQGKSIAMTSPVQWVLLYRSNYSLAQVKRVLTGVEPVRLDYLRQFVVNALVLQLLLTRQPKLVQLFADLGWEVRIESPAEFRGLPLVLATSILKSFRPPDDLVLAATAFSGVPAFIELIDLEAARHPKNPLREKLEALLRD